MITYYYYFFNNSLSCINQMAPVKSKIWNVAIVVFRHLLAFAFANATRDFTPANALIYAFILCNFQCTIAWTEFFWTLAHCQRLHADSRIRKQLINSSLRLQLNDSLNCCKVLRLRPGMFGVLIEWNLFGLAELYIRVWILSYSSHSLQVLRPCELRSLALAPLYRKIP